MSANENTMPAADGGQSLSREPTPYQDAETERPKIGFPYINLDVAVHLAETVHSKGGSSCELAQLAAWLDTTLSSSKFRGQVSAAKMFGLIEPRSKIALLTELGKAIVDPQRRDAAKVDAFLKVPLYGLLHDKFAGQLLPPDAGLEAEMRSFGVTEKSAAKARQAFQRSASSAGFFASGKDRMVRPPFSSENTETPSAATDEEASPTTLTPPEGQKEVGPSDPLLIGLWSKLPSDKPFSKSQRSQWLKLAELALNLVYGEDGEDDGHPVVIDPAIPTNPERSIHSGQPL